MHRPPDGNIWDTGGLHGSPWAPGRWGVVAPRDLSLGLTQAFKDAASWEPEKQLGLRESLPNIRRGVDQAGKSSDQAEGSVGQLKTDRGEPAWKGKGDRVQTQAELNSSLGDRSPRLKGVDLGPSLSWAF